METSVGDQRAFPLPWLNAEGARRRNLDNRGEQAGLSTYVYLLSEVLLGVIIASDPPGQGELDLVKIVDDAFVITDMAVQRLDERAAGP